ncbi:MAG: hypothetical protein QM666_11575 [Acinetobacter sp.]
MSYAVYLKVENATYQHFLNLQQQLHAGSKHKLAHELGDVLAEVAIQVIQQVFIDLLEQQKQRLSRPEGHKIAEDSEKVVQHVLAALQKYLPWSIAFLSNERLKIMVDYFANMVIVQQDEQQKQQIFLHYAVDSDLITHTLNAIEKIREGEASAIPVAFSDLTKIIDVGVDQLARQPKSLLHFTFVVDKTLNGVIQLCTNLAYKRLEGLGQEVELGSAPYYVDHFLKFLHPQGR